MCRFLRSNILLYPPRPAPEVVHTTQFPALYHAICLCVTVLRPGRPEVRILPVAPRAAPYGVLLFLFCMNFVGQQKGGFEQPVPRALRPAGQKRPGGNFLFFVVCMMSLFRLPRGKLPLALLAVPTGKDGQVECPRQTVNDFIGIRGSVWGLFLFVQTHAPLIIPPWQSRARKSKFQFLSGAGARIVSALHLRLVAR